MLITNQTLRDEIKKSIPYSEKTGKHTDKLGIMLDELTNIVYKRYNVTLSNDAIYDIKMEVIIKLLKTINAKTVETVDDVEDWFDYLYQAAIRWLIYYVNKERGRIKRQEDLLELVEAEYGELIKRETNGN